MILYKPVSINKLSFAFCRYSVAFVVWLAFIVHSQILLFCVIAIFFLSAILKVKRAPMILLGDITIAKLFNWPNILVNENAIFFAHLIGLFFSVICITAVYFIPSHFGWYSVGIFAVLKSISALGYCPATKLYECFFNGNCCINTKTK